MKALGHITAFGLIYVAGFFTSLLSGLVFHDLWAWFVVPIFQVRPISTLEAVGLMLTFTMLIKHLKSSVETKEGEAWWKASLQILITSTLGSLLFWGTGAIWHAFL